MMTKFDIDEEVYLKATVKSINITKLGEIKYTLVVQDIARNLTTIEENIVKKEDNE